MSSKNPTRLELFRSYDPVIRQHVGAKEAGKYGQLRDPEILYANGLPRDARPVMFVCRVLNRTQREIIETISVEKSRWRAAFRFGLIEIRDIRDEHGRPRSPSTWTPTRGNDELLDDAQLDGFEALGFGDADVYDIGSAVEALSTVGKGQRASCPLPDSSRRAWLIPSSSRRAEPTEATETPAES